MDQVRRDDEHQGMPPCAIERAEGHTPGLRQPLRPWWSSADGVIDDLASDDHQLAILVLAQRTQPDPCVVLGATAPTHQDANRLVDDGSRLQGRLQPSNQPLRLRQHLRIWRQGPCSIPC
jgi:hypothetical protein